MARIVLRVLMTSGDHLDLTYDEPEIAESDQVLEHLISELAGDAGVIRTRHGDRLIVLYSRGVAGFEVSPRGAVL
ncbi:hypothetical protein [Actinopolymorpha pittospori]|jgi:hypothetical protein